MEELTIIGGILSLISVIVFFVMAGNISALLKEQRKFNADFLIASYNAGLRKATKCPNCQTVVSHWKHETNLKCTKCKTPFIPPQE
jgi:ribosomal protein S27AE